MKTRTLASILILILVVLIIVGSCAAKHVRTKSDEALYGIWVNPEYKSSSPSGMEVYNSDGKWHTYRKEASAWEEDIEILEGGWIRGSFGTFAIEDKWIDADTNVWYKVVFYEGTEHGFMLMKVSNLYNILEYMYSYLDYPVEIDAKNVQGRYRIYYRQE
jgi:hypothetical protein